MRPPVIAALALAFALAACGGNGSSDDDPGAGSSASAAPVDLSAASADEVLAAAKKALADADSVAVSGEVKDDGTTIAIDFRYSKDDGAGTMSIDGDEVELRDLAGTAYFKGSADFWTSQGGGAAASALGGKWVVAKGDFTDFADLISRSSFLDETLKPEGKVTKGDDTTVDGVECVTLVDGENDGELHIDKKTGRPVSISGGSTTNTVTFTYDRVELPDAPSDDEIVDPTQLG